MTAPSRRPPPTARRTGQIARSLALPINALDAIALDPPADPRIAAAARTGQPCRSMKIWALAENVPAGLLAVGWGPPLQWLGSVEELDGAQLLVGFAHDRTAIDPDDPASVQSAIECYAPGGRVLAVDSHDWNGDPWSRGAWGCGARAGLATGR